MNIETKLGCTLFDVLTHLRFIEDYAPKQCLPLLSNDVEKRLKLLPDTVQKIDEAWKAFRQDRDAGKLAQNLEGIGYVNRNSSGEFIDLIVQGQKIGKGATHIVYQGYSLNRAKFVALKVVKRNIEIEILSVIQTHCRNEKIAYQIYDVFPLSKENAWVSVDKCYEGTLRELIFYQKLYDPINIALDLIESLNFLISKIKLKDIKAAPLPYSHRDIKPDNILVTKKMRAVLADFNACGPLNGSPLYMSPEKYQLFLEVEKQKPLLDETLTQKVLNFDQRHSQAADIWALGLVFGNLFARDCSKLPFPSLDRIFQNEKIDFSQASDENVLQDIQILADSLSSRMHQDFVAAILPQMLQFDPDKRISAKDLEVQINRFKEFAA